MRVNNHRGAILRYQEHTIEKNTFNIKITQYYIIWPIGLYNYFTQ